MGYPSGAKGAFGPPSPPGWPGASADRFEAGEAQLQGYGAGELLAEDLRAAQDALGEITGAMTADELLGKIFGSFCIGK